MAEIQSQVMKPITAPSDPYVSLNLPKSAAYHENNADAASHRIAASALPVCTENLSSGVVVMKPAQDGA